jgi:hypothetical protein
MNIDLIFNKYLVLNQIYYLIFKILNYFNKIDHSIKQQIIK